MGSRRRKYVSWSRLGRVSGFHCNIIVEISILIAEVRRLLVMRLPQIRSISCKVHDAGNLSILPGMTRTAGEFAHGKVRHCGG